MPCDIVDGEPSPYEVQLVTEIAREGLMHAIIERWITLRLWVLRVRRAVRARCPAFLAR
jgi:hypothetical protein